METGEEDLEDSIITNINWANYYRDNDMDEKYFDTIMKIDEQYKRYEPCTIQNLNSSIFSMSMFSYNSLVFLVVVCFGLNDFKAFSTFSLPSISAYGSR